MKCSGTNSQCSAEKHEQKTSLLISYIFLEEFYHIIITCYAQPSQKALTLPEPLLKAA